MHHLNNAAGNADALSERIESNPSALLFPPATQGYLHHDPAISPSDAPVSRSSCSRGVTHRPENDLYVLRAGDGAATHALQSRRRAGP